MRIGRFSRSIRIGFRDALISRDGLKMNDGSDRSVRHRRCTRVYLGPMMRKEKENREEGPRGNLIKKKRKDLSPPSFPLPFASYFSIPAYFPTENNE